MNKSVCFAQCVFCFTYLCTKIYIYQLSTAELKFSREVGFHRTSSNSSLSDSSAAEAPARPPPPDYAREMAETIASLRKLSREDDLDSPDRKSPASSRPQPRRSVERAPVTSQLKEKVTFTSERVPSTKLVKTMVEHTSETTVSRNPNIREKLRQRSSELASALPQPFVPVPVSD